MSDFDRTQAFISKMRARQSGGWVVMTRGEFREATSMALIDYEVVGGR